MDVDRLLGTATFDYCFTISSCLRSALVDEIHREAARKALQSLFTVVQLPKSDSTDKSGMHFPKFMLAKCFLFCMMMHIFQGGCPEKSQHCMAYVWDVFGGQKFMLSL
jgi:hypothetical protein